MAKMQKIDPNAPEALLFQTGYLTIRRSEPRFLLLGIFPQFFYHRSDYPISQPDLLQLFRR